ncbi:MAG: Calx-beta domain-containing protein [Alphaproteobacteria bacterium]
MGFAAPPVLAAGEELETLILNRGRTFIGRIVDANRNTVAIRNAAGLPEIVRADDIQTVFIPAKNPEDKPFFGSFVDWKDGVYQLNINFELVRVKDGVMLGEPEPIAPAKPAPADVVRPVARPSEPIAEPPSDATPTVPVAVAAAEPTAPAAEPAAPAGATFSLLIEGSKTDEGAAGGMTYHLTLSGPLEQPFYLAYSTLDGSARAGEDYQPVRDVLIIPAGEQRAAFSIALIDDDQAEQDETFTLSVGASNRSVEIDRSRLESVIVDNDR